MRTKSKTKSKVSQAVEVRTKVVLGIMLVATFMVAASLIALPLANLEKATKIKPVNSIQVTKTITQKKSVDDWGSERLLSVCDFNSDSVRDLSDVAFFAECQDTFDANGDGEHNLVDLGLYAQNNLDDNWCLANMSECYSEEEDILSVCDFNNDGVRDVADVSLFAMCQDTFDANGDLVHNLNDVVLYAQNNLDDEWCLENMLECYATSTLDF